MDEVTVETDASVAVIEMHRPPANFFDEALLTASGRRHRRRWRGTPRSAASCSARKASISARAPTCAAWDQTRSGGSTGRHSGCSPAASRSWQRCRAPRLAADSAWRWPPTSGSRRPNARLAANFARLGFHQGFGLSVTLPKAVGQQRALDLLYTGRDVSGEEGARMGLCDQVSADPRAAATEFARRLAESAPLSVAAIRATMRSELASQVRSVLDAEAAAQSALLNTADFREGLDAAVNHSSPTFVGA